MIERFFSDAENKGPLDKHIKITSNIKKKGLSFNIDLILLTLNFCDIFLWFKIYDTGFWKYHFPILK